jgi:hypothetical protein
MRRLLPLLALLPACSSLAPSTPDATTAASPFGPEFVQQVGESGWVFRARVTEAQPGQVTVEIEQCSLEPLEAPLPAGTHDTVVLTGPALAVGDEAYFLVTWQSAGETWTFSEIGRLDGALDFAAVHEAVHRAHRYWLERALADRLAGSDRVIHATVTGVQDLGGPDGEGPHWWQATLAPWHTLLGTVSIDPITVRFEGSDDECCYQWPKLHVGDQAIYLLQREGSDLVLDNPLDRQDLTELERVRSLLASPPAPPAF